MPIWSRVSGSTPPIGEKIEYRRFNGFQVDDGNDDTSPFPIANVKWCSDGRKHANDTEAYHDLNEGETKAIFFSGRSALPFFRYTHTRTG